MLTLYTKDDKKILSLSVGDNSYRHRELMGENTLTLYFELSKHVEIPIGAYVDFGGDRYTLMRPEALKMHHTRRFEYTLTLDSAQGKMKLWKMRNLVDGRLKFTLTAKPIEHLRLLVDNLNRREMGWSVGTCTDDVEHLVSYDHASCWEALGRIAEEFKTEFEIVGHTINLGKVEHERSNPLSLAYGKGKGFISGVGRSNQGDNPPTEVLFVQGGERNIDASKYGSSTLHLPKQGQIKYDGQHFEGEAGYDAARANTYIVDDLGLSVRRHGGQIISGAEDSLDASSIYPKRVGKVSEVIVENAKKNFYDFVDASLPDALNYNDCLIAGEKMTVIFQSGMLAGREFEVKYHHDIKGTKKSRRFEIVPQEVDGQTMPNATYCPRVGDEYAVFHCQLPQVYISQPAQKVGAEWDMLRKAVKHLYEHEQQTFTFTGELDGIWARRNWVNVGGRLRLGSFVRFTDPQFQPQGVDVRIIGIKDYINNPHAPQIELSNAPLSGSFSTTISKLEAQKLEAEQLTKAAVQFTQRQFRDARETMEMLEAAMADKFTRAISPAAVQTMALLVGDESLQFRFVSSRATPTPVAHEIRYDSATKQLRVGAGLLQHLTIGIKSISSAHSPKEYRFWDIPAFTSGRLDVEEKKYYLYVRVPRNGDSGAFYLSETAKSMDSEPNFYHLLVGILNSEYGGERSFVKLYGYSEILPGRITTDRIVSYDGRSYFDMVANAMKLGDALDFNSRGDGRLLLRGTLVQNDGGEAAPIPLYRGEWNASATYYQGDEVVRTENSVVTSYRYVATSPSAGKPLSDTSVWAISAKGANGQKGDAGRDGRDGAKGDKGDTGQRGADGAAGRDGAKGETGAQGPQGEKGLPGKNGVDGKDGRSSYTHVRYSADGGQTFTAATAEAIEAAKKLRGTGLNLASTLHPAVDYIQPWRPNVSAQTSLLSQSELPIGAFRGLKVIQPKPGHGIFHFNGLGYAGGKHYTMSFWAKADAAHTLEFGPEVYGAAGLIFHHVALSTEWTFYQHTFPLFGDVNCSLVLFGKTAGTYYYSDIKFEEGDVATPWTPCALDAAVGTTSARYRGEWVSEQPVASLNPKAYTWVDTKGEKGDGGKDGLTPLPNLLRNADLPSELGAWGVNRTDNACSAQHDPSVTPPIADAQVWGLSPSNQANSFAELHQDVDLIAGRTYTFSVYTKGATAGWLIGYPQGTHFHLKSDTAETLGEWKRFSSTFSATASGRSKFYLRAWNKNGNSGKVLFSCPKAEEGTQATPWTRAAEDFRPDYTEMRFAVNGSRTAPPVLNLKERSPQGWSIGQPAVGQMQFLWMSTAQVSGATDVLKSDWSAPVRITPADGQKGDSPAMAYRGEYDAAKTYYGTSYRVDVVKYGKEYFVARTDAGEFRAVAPPNASKWNNFGANFESVATQLLLAEDANIGDWYLSQGSIVSTLNESSWISLDARANEIAMHTDHGGGRSTDIMLDASSGSINVQTKDANGLKDAASISGDGMFSNNAGVRCWPSTTGVQQFAAMCGYGVANLARAPYAIPDGFDSYAVVGVFGRAENTNTTQYKAPAYGGLFYQLKACGFIQNVKKIGNSDLNTQLTTHHTRVIGLTSNNKDANVRLPSGAVEGQTISFTQVGDGSMSILPPIGDGEHRILRYGNAPQTSWIVRRGETVCLTMIEGVVLAGQNGYKVWVVEMK
jgi:hypothetical protein